MKKAFLILMLCIPLSIISGSAQTKQESIKELFKVMKQDSLMDKMMNSIVPSMMAQMKSQYPIRDSVANERSTELMKATMEVSKNLFKKIMDEDMVQLYDKYFSLPEIKAYIAFYKSPAGKKFIEVTPLLTQDLMTIVMQKYVPEIQSTMKAKFEELKNSPKK